MASTATAGQATSRILVKPRRGYLAEAVGKTLTFDMDGQGSILQTLRVGMDLDSGGVTYPYSQHPWVHAAINAFANPLSRLPFRIYTGDRNDKQEIEESGNPWVALFDTVNPFLTPSQFWKITCIQLGTTGESFWIFLNKNGEPINEGEYPFEVYPIGGNFIDHKIDRRTSLVASWKMNTSGGGVLELLPHQVLQIKEPDPNNPYRGLSPLAAAALAVSQDHKASVYNDAFFDNGANTGGWLKTSGSLTKEQAEQILSGHEARHRGVRNTGRPGLLTDGMDWIPDAQTHRDMAFLDGKKWNRGEVAAVYNVTEYDLGDVGNVNKAVAQTQERRLYTKAIIPKAKDFEDHLWKFMRRYDGGKFWGEFDWTGVEALKRDHRETVDTAAVLYKSGFATRNEVNRRYELGFEEDSQYGDTRLVPMGFQPVAVTVDPFTGMDSEPTRSIRRAQVPAVHVIRKAPENYWATLNTQIYQSFQPRFRARVRQHWYNLRKEMVSNLDTLAATRSSVLVPSRKDDYAGFTAEDVYQILFDHEMANEAIGATLQPLYDALIQRNTTILAQELGGLGVFNIDLPEVVEFARIKLNLVTGINQTVRNNMVAALTEAIERHDTVTQLRSIIRERFNIAASRSLTIARTETAQTTNGIRFIGHVKEEVTEHEWVTAGDEFVRDDPPPGANHDALNGEKRKIGEAFSNGLLHPGDLQGPAAQVVNCRCCAYAT